MTRSADATKEMGDFPLREIRLLIPDPNSPEVRRRVAESVAKLSRKDEDEALAWIESVSEFDEPASKHSHPDPDVVRK